VVSAREKDAKEILESAYAILEIAYINIGKIKKLREKRR